LLLVCCHLLGALPLAMSAVGQLLGEAAHLVRKRTRCFLQVAYQHELMLLLLLLLLLCVGPRPFR